MFTWLLVIIALIGTVLNVQHDRRGFVLWAISNLGLAIINARSHEWAQASLWIVYVLMAVWGWLAWGDPYPPPKGSSMNDQPTDNFSAAFILSLAAALIEVVRDAVPVHSAAGNRLARAAETTERAIEYIPRDSDPFPPMFLASEFLPMITARIQSAVVHGGWRRGEKDLDRFFQDMLARLNDPKNVAKGDYLAMSWQEVRDKLQEERGEVDVEMLALATGHGDRSAAIREFADEAVVAMIGAAKIAATDYG